MSKDEPPTLKSSRNGFYASPKDEMAAHAIGSCSGGKEPTQISKVGQGKSR